MGIGERLRNFDQQLDPLPEIEIMLLAIVDDVAAFDQLAGQPRTAVFVDATVNKACDARMLETCQDASLDREARRIGVGCNELQCGAL